MLQYNHWIENWSLNEFHQKINKVNSTSTFLIFQLCTFTRGMANRAHLFSPSVQLPLTTQCVDSKFDPFRKGRRSRSCGPIGLVIESITWYTSSCELKLTLLHSRFPSSFSILLSFNFIFSIIRENRLIHRNIPPLPARIEGIFSSIQKERIRQNLTTIPQNGKRETWRKKFALYPIRSVPSPPGATWIAGGSRAETVISIALLPLSCSHKGLVSFSLSFFW